MLRGGKTAHYLLVVGTAVHAACATPHHGSGATEGRFDGKAPLPPPPPPPPPPSYAAAAASLPSRLVCAHGLSRQPLVTTITELLASNAQLSVKKSGTNTRQWVVKAGGMRLARRVLLLSPPTLPPPLTPPPPAAPPSPSEPLPPAEQRSPELPLEPLEPGPPLTQFVLTTNNVPYRQCATELRENLPPPLASSVRHGKESVRGVSCCAPAAQVHALARLTLPERVYATVCHATARELWAAERPPTRDELLTLLTARCTAVDAWAGALAAYRALHPSLDPSAPFSFAVVANRRGARFKESVSSLELGRLLGSALHATFGWRVHQGWNSRRIFSLMIAVCAFVWCRGENDEPICPPVARDLAAMLNCGYEPQDFHGVAGWRGAAKAR